MIPQSAPTFIIPRRTLFFVPRRPSRARRCATDAAPRDDDERAAQIFAELELGAVWCVNYNVIDDEVLRAIELW